MGFIDPPNRPLPVKTEYGTCLVCNQETLVWGYGSTHCTNCGMNVRLLKEVNADYFDSLTKQQIHLLRQKLSIKMVSKKIGVKI